MRKRMYIYVCDWVTLLYSREKNCIGEVTIKKIILKKRKKSFSCWPTLQPQRYGIQASSVTYTTAYVMLDP